MIAGSALLAPLAPAPTVYANSFISNTATQAIVEQSAADLLGIKIEDVAKKYKISSTTLTNLVESESGGDPTAIGDHGCSLGIVQINTCAHKVTSAQAHDVDFSLDWAAKQISLGNDWWWTSCNCYSYVQANFIKDLPRMNDIQPNSGAIAGSVAIFYYHDRQSGAVVKHIAYVKSVSEGKITIAEANKQPCITDTRTIHTGDDYLAGFWTPYGS